MIENIIFDFGGVLLNLDYSKTYQALSKVLEVEIEDTTSLGAAMEDVFNDFERGNISEETFLWNLQRLNNKTPNPRALIDAWNAMLLGWNPARFEMLKRLNKKYKVYLLSNTNSLHIDWVHKDLKNNHNTISFEVEYFDKAYYSHLIHMRKPDHEIYRYVIDDAAINPQKTIFIDDNLSNIQAANECDLIGIHHDPKHDIVDVIDQYIANAK